MWNRFRLIGFGFSQFLMLRNSRTYNELADVFI
jgi:hypothetical protein